MIIIRFHSNKFSWFFYSLVLQLISKCFIPIACDEKTLFQCMSGECIKTESLCDGDLDCVDRTDESNCSKCPIMQQSLVFRNLWIIEMLVYQYTRHQWRNQLHC